jgi:lysophospholipase L1-like esterase
MPRYQEAVRKLADEFGAVFVPLQAAFDDACNRTDASYWIWDGVHPTAAGHELIARQWLAVVQESHLAIR